MRNLTPVIALLSIRVNKEIGRRISVFPTVPGSAGLAWLKAIESVGPSAKLPVGFDVKSTKDDAAVMLVAG
jgi:hypothetical protein